LVDVERTYDIVGMTCDHCVAAVTEELTNIPGVTGVDVDLATGAAVVRSDGTVEDEAVRSAVEEAGYAVAP
jgi:copper chaperone CopZ